MHRVKFKVTQKIWEEKEIAKFILGTIHPNVNDNVWLKDGEDHRWQLGGSNDWFMGFDPETREVELSYRYGGGHNIAATEALESLAKWFEWKFK